MRSILILIGPMCAGKSTLAKILAKKMKIPRIELDEVRQRFYNEIGYDEKYASEIVEKEGMMGLIQYWKPYEAHAVERALQEFDRCVLDFGAGHSVYEEQDLFLRVKKALLPQKYVFLILPSPDIDQSVKVVNQRFSDLLIKEVGKIDPELLRLNEHFVRHPSNQFLAKKIIYTEGKKPKNTCQEILDWISENGGEDFKPKNNQPELF